jgi:hypothetical protein
MDIACVTNGAVVKDAACDCRYQLCMKPIILMAKSFYNFNRVSEREKKLAASGLVPVVNRFCTRTKAPEPVPKYSGDESRPRERTFVAVTSAESCFHQDKPGGGQFFHTFSGLENLRYPDGRRFLETKK